MDIYKKLDSVIEELRDDSTIHESKEKILKIPTLEKDYYREVSPQLEARFSKLGYWEDATHGDWLDVEKMKLFWDKNSEKLYCNECLSINHKKRFNRKYIPLRTCLDDKQNL